MMKTNEQIDEFIGELPIGNILQVPEIYNDCRCLDLNGDIICKDQYPVLTERLKKTVFDLEDDHLWLIPPTIFFRIASQPGYKWIIKVRV